MSIKRSLVDAYRERPYRNIFVALMVVILAGALFPNVIARDWASNLMIAVIMVAALIETVRTRHNALWAAVLGLPAIALRVLAVFVDDSRFVGASILAASTVFLAFLIWNLLHDLVRPDRSTSERVFGALCAYIFIGMFFALYFAHIAYQDPTAFKTPDDPMFQEVSSEADLIPAYTYFSFVTLTTLGYGDVTPVAEHVRTLSWLEALIGQLYLAVMIAGLVGRHIAKSMG